MKKIISIILSVAMLFSLSVTAFAAEPMSDIPNPDQLLTASLDELDLSKTYSDTKVVYDDEGNPITLSFEFEPTPRTRGSSTNNASVGTWTSSVDYGVISMSYKFDLEKYGSQWKMSNARSHQYSGLFTAFSNPRLTISRAISTNTFPCEINASVDASLFDNQWVHIYSGTWLMSTTVNSSGTMTLTWN